MLRGGPGTLIGRLTGLLGTGLTPSARTDNWLYAYGEVAGALDLAGRLVRLGSAVVAELTANVSALQKQAVTHFTAAADLAEELTQRFGLDYRTAYRVVGRTVATTMSRGGTELTVPAVRAAAEQVTGTPVPLTLDMLRIATDPMSAVLGRDGLLIRHSRFERSSDRAPRGPPARCCACATGISHLPGRRAPLTRRAR